LSTFDEKAQREMIQKAIPEVVFETTADGSTIIEVPTKDGGTRRSVLNQPGLSAQDLTTGVAKALSFVPAAKIAGLGKTLLTKFGIGAAGAGATEQASQELGVQLGREDRDPIETAIAAGTGGAAELVVPAIQAFRGARQAKRTGIEQEAIDQAAINVPAAQEAADKTGIPLFKGQKTAIPSTLDDQAFFGSLPAGTQSAVEGLRTQNKAAGDAVAKFIRDIAPADAIITGAERVRTAAQTAVSQAKRIRKEASSPIYKQAFRRQRKGQLDLIDTSKLETKILEMSKQFDPKGQIAKNLTSSLEKIKNAKGNLQKLHLAKTEIDQTINSFGADSVGNTTKRFMSDINRDLTGNLVDQSPSYRAARSEFIRTSPEVANIQNSIIGKIANLDDTQLKQVTAKLFDPAQTDPSIILKAKRSIQDVDPDAWNEIIRVELERRLGSIKSSDEFGSVENIPGQLFRALFPNDKSTRVLFNSLDGEAKNNLRYLRKALGRAKLGRIVGSPTAGREARKKELKGGFFRDLFRNPINTIVSTGEDTAFNLRVSALAKALYDPRWKADMAKVRKFNPDTPAASRAMTQLIKDIETTTQDESR